MKKPLLLMQRYLLLRLFLALGAGLGLYSVLFLIQNLFVLSDVIVERHAPVAMAISFVSLYMPKIVTAVFPFAVLFASSFVTNQWAATSQLTAINAVGTPLRKQLTPHMILSLTSVVLFILAIFSFVPWSKVKRDEIFQKISVHAITSGIKPGIVQELAPGVFLRTLRKQGSSRLKDVLLVQWPAGRKTPTISCSDTADIRYRAPGYLVLNLRRGTDYFPVQSTGTTPYSTQVISFQQKQISIPLESMPAGGDSTGTEGGPYSIRQLNKWPANTLLRQAWEGDPGAIALLLRRLLLVFFVFTAPFLGFFLSFRLHRGSGASSAFLASFLLGLLFVVGAKLVESITISHDMEWGLTLFVCILMLYIQKLWKLYVKLKETPPTGSPARSKPNVGLTIFRKILEYIDIFALSLAGFRKIPLLFRYVGAQTRRMVALSAAMLIGLFIILSSFNILPKLLNGTLDGIEALSMLWWTLVASLPYTVPLVFLVGVLMTVSILDGNSEITAMKATAVSVLHITGPMWRLSVVFVVALLGVNTFVAPVAHEKLKRLELGTEAWERESAGGAEGSLPRVRIAQVDKLTMVLFPPPALPEPNAVATRWVVKWNTKKDIMEWASVFSGKEEHLRNTNAIPSPTAETPKHILVWGEPGVSGTQLIASLQTLNIHTVNVQALTSFKLRRMISVRKQIGARPYGLVTTYYARFADALTPIILLILGLPLMFMGSGRESHAVGGMVTALLLAILYYTGSAFFHSLGSVHYLPPFLAAWSMNLLFGTVGLFLGTGVRS